MVKPEHKEALNFIILFRVNQVFTFYHFIEALSLFEGTGIVITDDATSIEDVFGGQRYLGAALGSTSFIEEYVSLGAMQDRKS